MTKLIPITIISLILAALSHKRSWYDFDHDRYIRKERFFYTIMAIALILFAGLRTNYNDTGTYVNAYNGIPADVELTSGIKWTELGGNPGFFFTMRLMKRLGLSGQSFIMVFSIFIVGTYLWFLRKYSCNIFLTILLFVTFAGYTFTLAAIKQCTAMALCLIATDRAIRKKYPSFLVYVILASMFHLYALMYLVVPFLSFRPWSKYTVIMITIFALVGIGMQSLLGTVLKVTDMLGEEYNAASFMGEGVNPFRLLVVSVPAILSLVAQKQIARSEERDKYIILNLTMLNAEIMFVALFGTANYFARLANYFLPFQAISIPWLLKHFELVSKRFLLITASVCYLLFCVYENAINASFDVGFYSITLWEYLKSLFAGGI